MTTIAQANQLVLDVVKHVETRRKALTEQAREYDHMGFEQELHHTLKAYIELQGKVLPSSLGTRSGGGR